MSRPPPQGQQPHSSQSNAPYPSLPYHRPYANSGKSPFHNSQGQRATSQSYGHGHPPFGQNFHPLPPKSAADISEADQANDNPWPSGEELSRKLAEQEAATGVPINIMGSRKARVEYVKGDVALEDPVPQPLSRALRSHAESDHSAGDEHAARHGQPTSAANTSISPHDPTAPTHTTAANAAPTRRVFAPGVDSNNAIMGQRVRAWGRKSPVEPAPTSPTPEQVADADEGSWADPSPAELADRAEQAEKDNQLRRWVGTVPPVSPDQGVAEMASTAADGDEVDLPPRPDSARAIPPPHVALVSDDESSDDSEALPTPRVEADKVIKPPTPASVPVADGAEADEEANDGADPWAADDSDVANGRNPLSLARSSATRGRSQIRGVGRGRAPHTSGRVHSQARPDWWRPAPHPVFSPKFSDRRLFIHFPVALREDLVRAAITQHFSRYGTIRSAFHHDSNGSAADKGVVVFEEPESVERCLADPRCGQFSFQSNPNFGRTELDITIERRHPLAMTRTIFIQITGSRVGGRPRSASPMRRTSRSNDAASITSSRVSEKVPLPQQPLPHHITVYAKPVLMRGTNRLRHFPTVLEPHMPWSVVARKLVAETGHGPEVIAEVDASPRVPERDIIPRLCDMLAEVVDLIPPTVQGGGWLVRVAGPHDTRRIFEELAKVPGIYVRWHHPGDGQLDGSPADKFQGLPMSPLGRLEHKIQAPVMRATSSSSFAPAISPVAPPTRQPSLSTDSPTSAVDQHPLHSEAAMPPFQHPFLRREIVYMYKDGRQVEREEQGTSTVFVDKRAIHISRLVKEKETKATLLDRFKHYGAIYNPASVHNTYATARVLYHERDAAVRARHGEDGKVSFGSVMKVVERIVQDRDVEVSHVYLDAYNNIISPAAAEQYSPPRPAETLFPSQGMPPLPSPMMPMGPYPQPPPTMTPYPYQSSPGHPIQPVPGYMMMPMCYGLPMAMPPPPPPPAHGEPSSFPGSFAPPQGPHPSANRPSAPTSTQGPDPMMIDLIPALGVYGPAQALVPFYPFYPMQYVHPEAAQDVGSALSPPISPRMGATSSIPGPQSFTVEHHPHQSRLPTPPIVSAGQGEQLPNHPTIPPSGQLQQPASALKATKFEWHQGELKPVYDPEDLKAWYESRGLPPPEAEASGGGCPDEEEEGLASSDLTPPRRATISEGSSDGGDTIKTGDPKPTLVPVPVPFSPQPTPAKTEDFVNIYPRVHPITPRVPQHPYIRSPKPTDKDDLERIRKRRARELEAQGYVLPLTPKSPVDRSVLLPGSSSDVQQATQRKASRRKKVPDLEDETLRQVNRERRRVPLPPPVGVYLEREAQPVNMEASEEDEDACGGW